MEARRRVNPAMVAVLTVAILILGFLYGEMLLSGVNPLLLLVHTCVAMAAGATVARLTYYERVKKQ